MTREELICKQTIMEIAACLRSMGHKVTVSNSKGLSSGSYITDIDGLKGAWNSSVVDCNYWGDEYGEYRLEVDYYKSNGGSQSFRSPTGKFKKITEIASRLSDWAKRETAKKKRYRDATQARSNRENLIESLLNKYGLARLTEVSRLGAYELPEESEKFLSFNGYHTYEFEFNFDDPNDIEPLIAFIKKQYPHLIEKALIKKNKSVGPTNLDQYIQENVISITKDKK